MAEIFWIFYGRDISADMRFIGCTSEISADMTKILPVLIDMAEICKKREEEYRPISPRHWPKNGGPLVPR